MLPKPNGNDGTSLATRRDRLQGELDQLNKQAVTVMVMDELPEEKRRTTEILERGGYDKPTGVQVTAGTPAVLPPMSETEAADRLALANWLIDPSHPLTARVTVNRYWQAFFGRGLVKSTEDFGSQGERPTHPELLDWLALQFVNSGWDVKAIHKLIVMSATYRQSSRLTEQARAVDPGNVWFGRSPAVPDALLDASRSSPRDQRTPQRGSRRASGQTLPAGWDLGGGDIR